MKIKKGDTVQVIAGKDKGVTGKVIAAYPETERVLVEGVNRVKKHTKVGQTAARRQDRRHRHQEAPIHVTNVKLSSTPTASKPHPRRLPRSRRRTARARRRASPSAPVRTSDDAPRRDRAPGRCRGSRRATASEIVAGAARGVRLRQRHAGPRPGQDRGQHGRRRGRPRLQADRGRGPRPRPRSPARSRRSPRPASRSRSSSCARACRSARTSRCAATGCGSSSTGCCRSRCRASATSAACRPKQFDGNGNYTFGLTEQSMFHEIDQDRIDRVRGMDITVVTTATTDDEGRALLQAPRLPLQGELTVAKKALINKADAQAEVRGARLHPLPAVRPSALGVPQVRPVPDLPARDGAPRRAARRHQEQLVTRT